MTKRIFVRAITLEIEADQHEEFNNEELRECIKNGEAEIVSVEELYNQVIEEELFFVLEALNEGVDGVDIFNERDYELVSDILKTKTHKIDLQGFTDDINYFISTIIPQEMIVPELGITFNAKKYDHGLYKLTRPQLRKVSQVLERDEILYVEEDSFISDINGHLYKRYVLDTLRKGLETPVCYDEYVADYLTDQKYLDSLKGLKL